MMRVMEGLAVLGSGAVATGPELPPRVGELTEHMREDVGIDPLTGLDTGARFERRLAQELKRAARAGHPTAVAVFELSGWQALEADAADASSLLVRVAAAVTDELRDIDTVGWLRGARFAALLPMCDTACVAGAVRRVSHRLADLSGLTVSAGAASTSETPGWELLDAAEATVQPVAGQPPVAGPAPVQIPAAVGAALALRLVLGGPAA
jgi:GGDEF domain-containing protein